jgi:subtilisin-like proprotein convertase family protein
MMVPRTLLLLAAPALFASSVYGQLTENYNFNPNKTIPDGGNSGTFDSQSISSAISQIGNVTVSLNIAGTGPSGTGMFNGDIYATLVHDTGFSVLLNRTGRTATSPLGYSDQYGFNIQLSDTGAQGDVHVYRATLFGNNTTALSGQLTGNWQPDARQTDPAVVVTTDPRTAFLSSFDGLDANGTWTLYVADLEPGGAGTLASWGLQITAVPEPGQFAAATGALLLAWGIWSRRHRTGAQPSPA